MATRTKKTPTPKPVQIIDPPTMHESYEMARTNQPTSYINKAWLVRLVPAGSMVAGAVYYTGVLIEEGTMNLIEAREYAAACLSRGFKKVGKMF